MNDGMQPKMSKVRPTKSENMYISSSLGVLFSRGVGLLAGAVSLWLLTRILDETDFAAYMLAMSMVYVCGFLGGFGLQRVLLLKISPLPATPGILQGSHLARSIGIRVFISSTCLALVVATTLYAFPELSAENDVSLWFLMLTPIVPTVSLTVWLIAWLQSNYIVGRPQSIYGQVDGLRCAGFGLVFAMGLNGLAVAVAAVLATIIPPLRAALLSVDKTTPEPSSFDWYDIRDGLNFFGLRCAEIGMRHADIIVLGFFAPPGAVASYAIASRLALILEAGQLVFTPAYTPRARQHFVNNTHQRVKREYEVSRQLGLLASGTVALLLVLAGTFLLHIFSADNEAYRVLLILSAGQILFVGAGLHSAHLSMSGHLMTTTVLQLIGFLTFLTLLFVLVPSLGALGAATAFWIANLFLAVSGLGALWWTSRIAVHGFFNFATLLVLVVSLLVAGYNPELSGLSATFMSFALTVILVRERNLLRAILSDICGQAFRRQT